MDYNPPCTLSERAVTLIAEIAGAAERFSIALEGPDGILLRKINHIRTIRGTTAIEGNALTEAQITAVLDGKRVAAPQREIEEIRGAHAAYEQLGSVDPYSERDLLRVHQAMVGGIVGSAGPFVDFMLERILETIKRKGTLKDVPINVPIKDRVFIAISGHPGLNRVRLAEMLSVNVKSVGRALEDLGGVHLLRANVRRSVRVGCIWARVRRPGSIAVGVSHSVSHSVHKSSQSDAW